MRIWIDVEDLFHYAAHCRRPSGIQRLAFELQRALVALAPDEVAFLRHDKTATGFVSVPFAAVNALFADLAEPVSHKPALPKSAPEDAQHSASEPAGPFVPPPARLPRRLARRVMAALPPRVAEPIRRFRALQREAFMALLDAIRAAFRPTHPVLVPTPAAPPPSPVSHSPASQFPDEAAPDPQPPPDTASSLDFATAMAPGDWLLVLGSPWFASDYASLVRGVKERHGLRFALLMYDIIPIRRPEWVDRSLARTFTAWYHNVIPLTDRVLAISRMTADDIEQFAAETGLKLPGRVQPVPIGTGFGALTAPVRTIDMPAPGTFVLIVSTIEARKNHMLLFRVWRTLLETMPAERVPTLVFAGRVGWLVSDLMQQLENANWLGGKIRLIEGPSDGELAALYEDCLFTVFPSLYEGWGLPVTESLAHGTPCLAADRTSLPEAGGTLARYFDPDDLHDAVRTVRSVLDDPAMLPAWRAEIRENFRPAAWTETAAATLRILRQDITAPVEARTPLGQPMAGE